MTTIRVPYAQIIAAERTASFDDARVSLAGLGLLTWLGDEPRPLEEVRARFPLDGPMLSRLIDKLCALGLITMSDAAS